MLGGWAKLWAQELELNPIGTGLDLFPHPQTHVVLTLMCSSITSKRLIIHRFPSLQPQTYFWNQDFQQVVPRPCILNTLSPRDCDVPQSLRITILGWFSRQLL